MHLKTTRMFLVRSVALLAAFPKSSENSILWYLASSTMVPQLLPFLPSFSEVVFFHSRVSPSVSVLLSAWVKKNCTSSATFEEDPVTSTCCCLHLLPDFETDILRNFGFRWEEISCCVNWAGKVYCFGIKLQHIIKRFPEWQWNRFRLEETCDWFIICQENCRFYGFPWNICKLEKCHVYCYKIFQLDGHLELCRGRIFCTERYRRMFFPSWSDFWSGLSSKRRA